MSSYYTEADLLWRLAVLAVRPKISETRSCL